MTSNMAMLESSANGEIPTAKGGASRDATRVPRVSIGLPVYNAPYLGRTVDSLLAQSFVDFEVIISDNASTDGTATVARDYAARDSRVRYIRNPRNIGVARNYNRTVDLARGQYFKWAASDDLIDPTFVEKCVKVLDHDRSVVAAFARTKLIDADDQPLTDCHDSFHVVDARPSDRLARVFTNLGLCDAQYGVIRLETLRKTHLLGNFVGSDLAFLAELALHGKLFEIQEYLFLRRMHAAAVTNRSANEIVSFYGTSALAGAAFRRWRQIPANVRSVLAARVGPGETARALVLIARKMNWDRPALMKELADAPQQLWAAAARQRH
jgi:glycosyltransferase involved in cell wall biosynthesis